MARVLLIDSDAAWRAQVTSAFGAAGHLIDQAVDTNAGAVALGHRRPDAVMVVARLSDRPGSALCRDLRRDTAVPIMVISEADDAADLVAALDAGAEDFVTLPAAPSLLVRRVEALLGRTG